MKKLFKKITVMVLAVMIFSALISYVYASSDPITINKFTSGFTYTDATDPKWKSNASPVSVLLRNSGIAGEYRVRTMGCGGNGENPVNCTFYGDQSVDYVVCARDLRYSIENTIRENNRGKAILMICPLGGGGTTTGTWWPDSVQTYRTPESGGPVLPG